MSNAKRAILIFGLSALFWTTAFVIHCVIHVRSVLATELYGYEKDVGFITLGFVFSWGIYYLFALLLTLLAAASLQFFLEKS
jgi:hypothetical protein